MKEYRVKGLSCGNCALAIENQLKRLEYGETAELHYNTGKLKLDPRISFAAVESILKADHAYIERGQESHHGHEDHAHSHGEHDHQHEHGDGHSHSHSHSHGHGLLGPIRLLILSAVLFAAAIIIDGSAHEAVPVSLYLLATVLSGYSTFLRGLRHLWSLRFTIDTLMTIALIGAIAIGEWKEATLVAILFGLNEILEGLGMEKARRSMASLLKVAPKEAVRLEDGVEKTVPIASLAVNDIVIVKPGGKIPSDGKVVDGKSSVNEAAITGESLPVEKFSGEPVYAGSINNEGVLRVQIDKAYEDSSLATILHLVEEAQETKTPTELFINKFAKYYTPAIMAAAVLVMIVPPLIHGGDWIKWLYQGLAVLIVGCPCALILSSPIAIVSGITRNARNGILIKGGVFLEQLGRIDTLAFDKTGTLTKGEPHVEKAVVYDEARFYQVAGSIEKSSSHPLAKAIMKDIAQRNIELPEADEIRTVPGSGIVAEIRGETYWLGNEQSIGHISLPDDILAQIISLKEQGLTLVLAADKDRVLGMFGIADEIREESAAVIRKLHRAGIRQTVMLTGDHQKTAEKVADMVGVTSCFSGLLPEDKVKIVKDLAARGRVAMIGDGINDAPALASAQLGIAMGKGTDSAIETADIVLMQDHLGKLPEAIGIAKQVNAVIRFNIAVALGLKLIALLLTIPGWLTLWIAILSDMGATIFVTLVSLTVLISRRDKAG